MKNILQDEEEEEQANDSNDLGSLEVSSGGVFFSAKKEEPRLEENEEIEQGQGDSNLFGKKEPQSAKAVQNKSISYSTNQRRLNIISNNKKTSGNQQFKVHRKNPSGSYDEGFKNLSVS